MTDERRRDDQRIDELLRLQGKTHESVLEMNTKLFDEQTGFVPLAQERFKSHSTRISALERLRWIGYGALAVIGWIAEEYFRVGHK